MVNVSRETWAYQFSSFPAPVLEDERLNIRVGWSVSPISPSVSFPTLTKRSLGLYPVVDDVAWVERLLPMGIKTIQLRIKDTEQADLEQQVMRAIELGREHNAQVFINDYWQLALKHGAFGVHLGQEDIDESNLETLADAGICLGLSTHGYYELLRVIQINPSYIALGHIFPTTTKKMPSLPQGLVRLKLYQQLIDTIPYGTQTGFPTVAIGGIDLTNADQVWQTGVSSLAVVRAITLAQDPQQVIDEFGTLMNPVDKAVMKAEVI
jgi:thiamine-phosphate pyrophosphorylase